MNTNNPIDKTQRKNRRSAIAFIFLFTISALFPIIASEINTGNKIMGIAGSFDITIALLCFVLFVALHNINVKHVDDKVISGSKKIVEYIAIIPLILIALYLSGLKINWTILLIGPGWRFWLLIMAIPYIIAAFQRND
jgi:hypothetical protein